MFENQPKGLYALALANTGERFGYYTMLAIFVLFSNPTLDGAKVLLEPCMPHFLCLSISCL